MLSVFCMLSFAILLVLVVVSYLPSERNSFLARPLARTRPSLRFCVWLAVIVAADCGLLALWRPDSGVVVRACVCDAIWLSTSLALMASGTANVRDLWGLGAMIGYFGLLALPTIVNR
jgi:hypothetical protein